MTRVKMMIGIRKILTASCGLAFSCGSFPLSAQQIAISKSNRSIAVSASAQAEEVADRAVLHIGFVIYGPDQESAYAAGSASSSAVVGAVTGAGVPKGAIESQTQSIQPVPQYGEGEQNRKFRVEQNWTVKCGANDAARILDVAVQAGANRSGQIDWAVSDPNDLEERAATLAMKNVKTIAGRLARGFGVSLGPLLYASNKGPSGPVVVLPAAVSAQRIELGINPREVTRSVTVYAVFAIP